MREHEKSISMIEQDMARSRAQIGATAEALKAKMEPENLADAARQVIVESTQRVEEKVKGLADSAGDRVESLGEQALNYFYHNPMPALLAGLGVGLLISLAERDQQPSRPSLIPTQPGRLNQTLASHPRLLKAQRKTVRQARRVNRQHPLLLGAAVLGAGMLLGALLPTSRREDELLGPTRDRLLETGKETAQHAIEQAKGAMEQELQRRKEEASELAETVEDTAMRAFHEARENKDEPLLASADVPNRVLPS